MKIWNGFSNGKEKRYRMRTLIAVLTALCVLLCMPVNVGAASNKGSDIRLTKTIGTVTIQTAAGKAVSVKNGMKLLSGYVATTGAKSYAWIIIDSTKAVKMNAVSKVKVKQSGGKLEVQLLSGAALVNVSKKLSAGESLDIRTSTTVTGIRGTAVYTEKRSETETLNATIEGTAATTITDPNTGEEKTITIPAGMSVLSVVGKGSGEGSEGIQTETKTVSEEELPGFVAAEVAENPDLAARMEANTSYDVAEIVSGAEERLAQDEAKAETQQQAMEKQILQQQEAVQKNEKKEASGGSSGGGDDSSKTKAAVTKKPEAATGLQYDGTPKDLLSSTGTPSGGTMVFSMGTEAAAGGTWSEDIPERTDANTYYVWFKVKGDASHYDSQPDKVEVRIERAAGSVSEPSAATLTLKDSEQELLTGGPVTHTGDVVYCLGTETPPEKSQEWSKKIPTGKEAGDYYVWYKAQASANYEESTPACLKVTIYTKSESETVSLDGNEDVEDVCNALETHKLVTVVSKNSAYTELAAGNIIVPEGKTLCIGEGVTKVLSGITVGKDATLNFTAEDVTCSGALIADASGSRIVTESDTALTQTGAVTVHAGGSLHVNDGATLTFAETSNPQDALIVDSNATVLVNGTIKMGENAKLCMNGSSNVRVSGTFEYNSENISLNAPLEILAGGTFVDNAGIQSSSFNSYISVAGTFVERSAEALQENGFLNAGDKVRVYGSAENPFDAIKFDLPTEETEETVLAEFDKQNGYYAVKAYKRTFDGAFDDVERAATDCCFKILLLKDVDAAILDIAKDKYVEKDITLDLHGCTVDAKYQFDVTGASFSIVNSSNTTGKMSNVKIVVSGANASLSIGGGIEMSSSFGNMITNNGGSVSVDGGEKGVKLNATTNLNQPEAFVNKNNGHMVIKNADVTVSNYLFSGCAIQNSGTLALNNARITLNASSISGIKNANAGTVSISGGSITLKENGNYTLINDQSLSVTVTGENLTVSSGITVADSQKMSIGKAAEVTGATCRITIPNPGGNNREIYRNKAKTYFSDILEPASGSGLELSCEIGW